MTPRRIAALSALTFFACVVVDFLLADHRRPFGYATSDTYYYLTVARHAVHDGRLAFDGVHATNGFHPLWQWLLVPITAVVELFTKQGQHLLYVVILLDAALIAGALYLLGLALTKNGTSLTPLYGLTVFGLYGVLAAFAWLHAFGYKHDANADLPSLHGTLWTYANGMESALLLVCFAVVAWLYATRDVLGSRRQALLFGLALAVMTLSRVDHVFVAIPIVATLAIEAARKWRERWRTALIACVAFAVPVGLWALSNRIWFGAWVPVSGAMKSDFPHVNHANLDRVWACIRHFSKQTYWRHYRVDQQVAPMAVAVLYLIGAALRRPASRVGLFLIPVAVGVVLLGAYDLLYVDLMVHGEWYTPVSTLFVSLAFVVALRGIRLPSWSIVLTLAASVYGFNHFHRYVTTNSGYWRYYYDVAPKIVGFYGGHAPRLLENDDGIVSFSTGFSSMAGLGLALDPEGASAWRTGQIVPLAVSRGFDRLTSAAYWPDVRQLSKDASEAELRAFVQRRLFVPSPETLHFRLEYFDGSYAVIAISR